MRILAPYISCLIQSGYQGDTTPDELEEAIAAGYKQIYIQTPQGFLKHHILSPGKDGEQRFIRLPVTEVPGLKPKEIGPDMHFLPNGKVPIKLLDEVKAFFRQVMKVKKTAVEAMIWVLWSNNRTENGGYYLHVPKQVVSHASAMYDWAGVPSDSSIIVDIHSHADFGAFFSGTDNNDDSNSVRFSGVIGNNHLPVPTSVWRFNYFSQKVELKIEDIFQEEEIPELAVSQSWLDAVGTRAQTGHKVRADGRIYQSPSHISNMQYNRFPRSAEGVQAAQTGQGELEYEFPEPNQERTGASAVQVSYKHRKDKKKHFGGRKITLEQAPKENVISTNGRHFYNAGGNLIEIFPDNTPTSMAEIIERVAKEEGLDNPETFSTEGLTPQMEDRIHQLGIRQAEEDALSMQAEEFLGSQPLEEDIRVGNPNSEAITLTLEKHDIPPEYDALAVNHGIDAANAYALIDHLSTDLINAPQVLSKSVEGLFQLVDDEYKLPLFRTLVSLLPAKAYDNLISNGL